MAPCIQMPWMQPTVSSQDIIKHQTQKNSQSWCSPTAQLTLCTRTLRFREVQTCPRLRRWAVENRLCFRRQRFKCDSSSCPWTDLSDTCITLWYLLSCWEDDTDEHSYFCVPQHCPEDLIDMLILDSLPTLQQRFRVRFPWVCLWGARWRQLWSLLSQCGMASRWVSSLCFLGVIPRI